MTDEGTEAEPEHNEAKFGRGSDLIGSEFCFKYILVDAIPARARNIGINTAMVEEKSRLSLSQ